jgi:hypothetical protein
MSSPVIPAEAGIQYLLKLDESYIIFFEIVNCQP